ncbi:MAG: S-layer homology domain-containing protein [Acidimicrobiia bacterium]|nr:S-layer homology domain-containing protein [Acidimicrobiia bacterium]
MPSKVRIVSVFVAALLALPAAASAAVDPFGADELGLVAYAEQVRAYSNGVDSWEVWVCDTANGNLVLNPDSVATFLNNQLDPYFSWLSGSRYRPEFRSGGTVTAGNTLWPDDPFDMQSECRSKVAAAATGTAAGALIVVDAAYAGGFATAGLWCEVVSSCPSTFPQNGRFAVVGGAAVTSVGGSPPALRTVAHEIGHAIGLPHSYGGQVTFLGGLLYEYDNAMDVMSGGDRNDLNIGTIGLNRYAAGWLDALRIRFHRGGTLTYRLSPMGAGGSSELLVLPTDGPAGVYDVLGARVRRDFDSGLPAEGIEVYRIDQSGAACDLPVSGTCWGVERRTSQSPVPTEPWTTGHVRGVGQTFTVRGVSVEVASFDGVAFTIKVSGKAVSERFVDDNGNFHEAAIEAIASVGITTGCNATTDRYCPGAAVSRAEMAAFLLRAIGDTTPASTTGRFVDVPAGAWYAPYVNRLAELGISVGYGDGTFRPLAGVSRAEMAVFLMRAFPGITEAPPASFTDVPPDAWYAGAAEGLLAAGVTKGCAADPLRFCPGGTVARDAMASFLARATGLAS